MGAITRGVKNTFRNGLRTSGIAVIIAVSMALAFSMLLAHQAVQERGRQLKKEMGSNLRVSPAGPKDFSAPAVPFTAEEAAKLASLKHVKSVTKHTAFMAQSAQDQEAARKLANQPGVHMESEGTHQQETNLASALDWASIGGARTKGNQLPPIPIRVEGTSGDFTMDGNIIRIKKGERLSQSDVPEALIGATLAEKNKLNVGSTFILGKKTYTVKGIFEGQTSSDNNTILLSFATANTVKDYSNEIPQLTVTAGSIDTVDAMMASVKEALGINRADVTSMQPEAARVVESLRSIQQISFVTFIIALVAAGLTILLTMLLVVREQKKEIGVLKALGATNIKVIVQFIAEAAMLTLIGSLIGMMIAAVAGNSILQSLISTELRPEQPNTTGAVTQIGGLASNPQELVAGISALVDWQFIAYGLGIAVLIALVAVIAPVLLIAKVRPAQVLRSN